MTETGTILVRTLMLSGRLGRSACDISDPRLAAGDGAAEGDGFSQMFSQLGGDADGADAWPLPADTGSYCGDSVLAAFLAGGGGFAFAAEEFPQRQDVAEGLNAQPAPDDAGGLLALPLVDAPPESALPGAVENPAVWCTEPMTGDRPRVAPPVEAPKPEAVMVHAAAALREMPEYVVAALREAPEYEVAALREAPEPEAAALPEVPQHEAATLREAPEYAVAAQRRVPEREVAVLPDVPQREAAALREMPEYVVAALREAPEYEAAAQRAPWDTSEEISAAAQATIASLARFWFPVAKPAPEQQIESSDVSDTVSVERGELVVDSAAAIIASPGPVIAGDSDAEAPASPAQADGVWSADTINTPPSRSDAGIAPAAEVPAADTPPEIVEADEEYAYGMPALPGEFRPVWRTPARAATAASGNASGSAAPGAPVSGNAAQAGGAADVSTQLAAGLSDAAASLDADTPANPAPATYDAPASPPLDGGVVSDMKLTVLRQETHFAPVMPMSPAEQIAGRITGEVAGVIASDAAASASSAASATAVDASSAPAASTVRVLHIRLDPPELGPLTVRMSMKNGALDLQLEASTPETAALIERDRETISGLLRTAGYAVDGLSVQVTAAPSANATANNGAQQQFSGQQPQQGWQQPGGQMAGQPGHGHHGQGDGRGAAMRGNADEIAEAAASRVAGGSVYL